MRGRSLFIFIRDLSYFTVPGYPFASPFERVVYNNTGVPGLLFNLSYCPAENLECNGLQPPHIKKDHYTNTGSPARVRSNMSKHTKARILFSTWALRIQCNVHFEN